MEVKDLAALKAAVLAAGCQWMEGQTTHKWYGRFMNDWSDERAASNRRDPKTFGKCEHAIKVPGVDYEIGVVRRPDGKSYDLVYDSWGSGRGLENKFGVGLPLLKQAYGVEVAKKQLTRQGYRVTTQRQDDGSIRLRAQSVRG
jgi:hypothetical protein